MDSEKLKSKSIGLVLSGGGVRGMAHIGVLRAMQEHGISAKMVSGSSVGALIAALYANGNSIADMLSFFKETPLFRYNFLTILKPGLVNTERYISIFKGYFPEDDFANLERELFVVATNLQKGEEEFFSSGELIRPLLASAALPPVFSPVNINNSMYGDGGIMNNFPLEPVKGKVDFMIGSNVSVIKQVEKKIKEGRLGYKQEVLLPELESSFFQMTYSDLIKELAEQPDSHRKILTYEAPIEFVYDALDTPTAIVSQSEIPRHLPTFAAGVRNALRRKPRLILVGEARDTETISAVLEAALTGHPVYTTLHSNGVAETIRRLPSKRTTTLLFALAESASRDRRALKRC